MSTCPDYDIHSIYLDGELPMAYLAKYEEHVASCPDCKAKLEKLRKLHKVFAQDSANIEFGKDRMEASWEKLESKLKFTRTIDTKPAKNFTTAKKMSYFVAGIAAAAVLGIVLPFGRGKTVQVQDFQPVARASLATPASTVSLGSMQADPTNLGEVQIQSLLGEDAYLEHASQGQASFNGNFTSMPTSAYVRNASGTGAYPATYDVFTPLPEEVISEEQKKTKGFNFKFYSPFANISLEIGSGN